MDQDQTNKQLVFHLNEYLNNETLSHRRRKNFAPKELNIIISMVEENADLIYNRVNKNPKFISKQEFWQTVTNMINENCHFAAQRDVKEVRRKWVTFQSEVKSKAREGTHLLNIHEKRVYDLIQLNSQISEGNLVTETDRLTMLPSIAGNNRQMTGDLPVTETANSPGVEGGFLEQISQSNSPSPALSGTASSSPAIKMENVTETELLMNICSQVMGLSPGDISAQVGGGLSLKDIISKPAPVSKVTNHPLTSIVPPTVTTVLSPAVVTPTRNVISVQPVNHVQTPPKRARLDVTPTSTATNGHSSTSAPPVTGSDTLTNGRGDHLNGSSLDVVELLREMVAQQVRANKISEERLAVERQRRDLESEKLEIERARYEIEKERLCQEIISRKKS